jgi:hypothetical protein
MWYMLSKERPESPEPGKGSRETCCFGLSTTQGLIEFKCESSSKNNWVRGVQNLPQQVDVTDQVGRTPARNTKTQYMNTTWQYQEWISIPV